VPADFTAISVEPVTISFDNGQPNPASVAFTYDAPEKAGSVYVSYVTDEGEFANETVTVTESSNVVVPNAGLVPADFTAISVEPVTISFDNGQPNPASVTFTYEAPEKVGSVYVSYVTDEGEFANETVTVTESSNVVAPNASLVPADFSAISVDPVTVTFDNGQPNPASVTFTYEAPEKVGSVYVSYVTDEGEFANETVTVTESSNVVAPNVGLVPADFTAISVEPVTISFDNGQPNPASVTFTYEAPEKVGSVYVSYVTDEGEFANETVTVTESSNVVAPNASLVPADFTAISVEPVTISFDNGQPNPASVTFTYDAPEKTGSVYVSYVTDEGEFANETVTVTESSNVVAPNAELVPADYTAIAVEPVTVTFDENGQATPAMVTFTYEAPEKTGVVTVSYVNQRGEFAAEEVTVSEASNVVAPNAELVPADYTAVSVEPQSITFDASGLPVPALVTFTYEAPPVTGMVTVNYVNSETGAVINSEDVAITEGDNPVAPNAVMIPEGYTAVEVTPVTVTLAADGTKTPDVVVFTYQAPPVTGTIDVFYATEAMGTFASETVDVVQGENTITPNAQLIPEGYTAVSADPVSVTLSADGTLTPASVTFTYQAPPEPPKKALVTFHYVDEKGKTILEDTTAELEDGSYNSAEYAAKPEGYTYQSATVSLIQISGGVANPAEVTFTYKKNVKTATLEIRYVDTIGKDIGASPEVVELAAGTHTILPNTAYIPVGYSLGVSSPQSYQITVGKDLVARPNTVSFTLVANSVVATVNVRYVDAGTMATIATQALTLRPGTHTISRNNNIPGATYEPSAASIASDTVTVNDLGQPSKTEVVFYYQKKQAEIYMGYALTNGQTALRSAYNMQDSSIKGTLPQNTLVYVNGQATVDGVLWSSVQMVLGNNLTSGVVQDSSLTRISKEQAQAIINQYNQQNPVKPTQETGYYITLTDNVPLRSVADASSAARAWLNANTVVYVQGQDYRNNMDWHIATYQGDTGYIRQDQLRKMTTGEVEQYLNQQQNQPVVTGTGTAAPYDPHAKSSYGYVTSSTVNFRQTPNGTKLKVLNRYAFALVLGTRNVNGVTWYNVNQNGTIGWIHGDYFHQLNLMELTSFLNSNEYKQGLANNSGITSSTTSGSTSSGSSSSGTSTGVAKPGNITSVEDWNVGTWQNTGVTTQTSYAPFNPIATATPIPSVSPSVSPAASPTATFVIGTMIPIDYEDESKETQTSTAPWGLIAAGVVLVGGAGGVYAYAMNQNRKRKMAAARAAQARRAQANAAAGQQSPYARRAVAAPNTSPVRPAQNPAQPSQNPYAGQNNPYGSKPVQNPYSNGSITGSAAAPEGTATPYAPMSTGSTAAPDASANPYAPMSGSTGAPVQNTFAPAADTTNPYTVGGNMGTNPFARPIGSQSDASAQQPLSANPYARPVNSTDPAAADRRRSSRMQRYHEAGDDQNGDNI